MSISFLNLRLRLRSTSEPINSQIEDFVSIWEDMKDDLRGEFILPEFGQSYEIDLERATKLSKRGAIKGA